MVSFQQLFMESKGQPITYQGKELKMVDRVILPSSKVALKVNFLSTDSKWKQGIVFQTKGEFEVNGQKLPTKIVLWEDTAPKELQLLVKSKDKCNCFVSPLSSTIPFSDSADLGGYAIEFIKSFKENRKVDFGLYSCPKTNDTVADKLIQWWERKK